MEEKSILVEYYCPNLIYQDQYFALGVLRTWEEYENHPLSKAWNYEKRYFEENIKRRFYFFTYLNKLSSYPSRCLLICTDFTLIGKPLWCINEEGVKNKSYIYYDIVLEKMREYLTNEYRRKEKLCKDKEEETKKATEWPIESVNHVEQSKNNLEELAYSISSDEFQFKTLKRSVIEHGKNCYIKGYKQHKTDFETFLLREGYFSKDELAEITNKFNVFLTDTPELTLETVERYLNTNSNILVNKDGKWVKPNHVELTDIQKNIFNYYTQLTSETPFLRIQKPRQEGVSTILKIIAQIEALSGKNVLYIGFDKKHNEFNCVKNLTYYHLSSYSDSGLFNALRGKGYDLIIVDEMIAFNMPYDVHDQLVTTLTEEGRMVIVGTPIYCESKNYKQLKKYFEMKNYPFVGKTRDMIHYCIVPSESDEEMAKRFPDRKNEILGEFFD